MTDWSTAHVAALARGGSVTFRPRGRSMAGRVEDGQEVTVDPLRDGESPAVGTVVLCTVRGRGFLHLVKAVRGPDGFLIGNNRGGVNGWIGRAGIHGTMREDGDGGHGRDGGGRG